MSTPNELPTSVKSSWHAFLETYEPHRPELHRYCRHLTKSPWDAEDLAQDTMARAFVTLAQMGESPPNARAWLFRVASNLWIDQMRRRRREEPLEADVRETGSHDPRSTREAAGTLIEQLSPQERAAVVLKDALDLSLEETADVLATTVGAIKAALHRARGKLVEPALETRATVTAPAVLDAFCDAFNAGDIDRLTALLLDTSSVEVVGATTQYGPEAARRTVLYGMLFGVKHLVGAAPRPGVDLRLYEDVVEAPPRVSAHAYRGGFVLLHFYAHRDGDAVRALTRLELSGEHVARLRNYFYNPELITEVCEELGVPSRTNGRRWWPSQG